MAQATQHSKPCSGLKAHFGAIGTRLQLPLLPGHQRSFHVWLLVTGSQKWWTLKKRLCLQVLLWSEGSILASSHLQLPSTESHLSIFLLHLLHALRPPQLVDRWALEEAANYFCSILALTRYLSKVYRFIACGIFLTWFHDPTIMKKNRWEDAEKSWKNQRGPLGIVPKCWPHVPFPRTFFGLLFALRLGMQNRQALEQEDSDQV